MSAAFLEDGNCKGTILIVKGHHVTLTMAVARETALASTTIFVFQVENTNIHGQNWKFHGIIVIETDLKGFVVTMRSGLCEQYVKSLGLTPSGFDFLFRTRPRALWQQTPPEQVLIP